MKLYNSLTKKVQDFKPIKKSGEVTLYTCGPTVYDHAHIGNLRTYIFEDTLRRVLKLNGYRVKHVMNLTDVDDKTIERSRSTYPDIEPKAALQKLTKHYAQVFLSDAGSLGIDFSESQIVKATEHIADMQKLIRAIPNHYYEPDGVYFDITKYKDYGVFTKLDQSHSHHRIDNDDYDKEHVADFALWKAKKGNEPSWDFELGDQTIAGRPGWHIECSAMATKYLGQPFDIHTGGIDLKFPHHENEIAQSTAANGKKLANYFLHAEHLLVDGKKMSKSLKNFYTIEDIANKDVRPMAFRLLVLQAHYRSQLNFSWVSLKAAQEFLQNLYAWSDLQFQTTGDAKLDVPSFKKQVLGAISNDLGTPEVISIVGQLVTNAEKTGVEQSSLKKAVNYIDAILALGLSERLDIGSGQKALITKREEARQNGDFVTSDAIRDELKAQGIGLKDNSYGVTWHRII